MRHPKFSSFKSHAIASFLAPGNQVPTKKGPIALTPNLWHRRFLLAAALFALPLLGVDTKVWTQNEMSELEKGELTHLSLSSDGRLHVAPVVQEIYDPSVTFLWALARDSKGNIYVGGGGLGGGKAKLSMIDSQGRGKMVAELDAISIQAI